MPERNSILPGEPVPPIVLANARGQSVDLTHQSIAGRSIALWLIGAPPTDHDLQALADQRDAFAAVEAQLYAVVNAPPGELSERAGQDILCDCDGRVAQMFDLRCPAVAVIDAAGRLAASVTDQGPAAALRICSDEFARTPAQTTSVQAPVLLVRDVLEPSLIQEMIDYWQGGEKHDDTVATARGGSTAEGVTIKRRRDVFVADPALFATIKQRLARRLLPEIAKAFQARIAGFEALRIGCYADQDEGHFGRHRDNRTRYTSHRLFAVSVNLNDGYRGGELRFPEYGRALYRPDAGAALVFSCSLLHEVVPVISGKRFALFTFLFDQAGAARERKLIQQEREAGRHGIVVGGGNNAQAEDTQTQQAGRAGGAVVHTGGRRPAGAGAGRGRGGRRGHPAE